MSELGNWVEDLVKAFIDSPENTMQNPENERSWGKPLVGFSSGADPLYGFYKEDIGSFFLTPLEWFTETFPGVDVKAEELTVISWILPQTEATKAEHRKQTRWPTERWARARIYGEEVNAKLRKHIVESLEGAGYEAVSPQLSPIWKGGVSVKYGRASSWSERHAAYTAGLGTFGLCDGLITPVGKAMRTGSVVARINIPPTPKPYEDHHAYCLLYMRGTCGMCIDRCPADAISEGGHDKGKCSAYLGLTREYVPENFGFKGYGCGLCQTGVPCESRIPLELAMDLNLPASSPS